MNTKASASVLVIGSGGREHAISWRLAQSPHVSRVIASPGNDGFGEIERWPADLSIKKDEFERLALKAKSEKIDLVVIGPDNALADGATDIFEKHGLLCFGPSEKASQIEASKAFAKDVMKSAGVPTAKYFVAGSSTEAQKILKSVPWQSKGWVVKADGLALGKGVRVCSSYEEAEDAVHELIEISGSLVLEERLSGEELSWFAFCDGDACALLEPARDYKRLKNNNEGPNTGGMGAFSPVPEVPAGWAKRIHDEVFVPTLREMKKRGAPFKGLLYAGLMADFNQDRFWVIEFNARFGDPETQVLLPRMNDDFYEWCLAVASQKLRPLIERRGFSASQAACVKFSSARTVGVVAAAGGYPEKPEKGRAISGEFSGRDGIKYFFAGVKKTSRGLETSGGRVLLALGQGADFESARAQAYQRINGVRFEGIQYRTDIAAGLEP